MDGVYEHLLGSFLYFGKCLKFYIIIKKNNLSHRHLFLTILKKVYHRQKPRSYCIAQGTVFNILWWITMENNMKKNVCVYIYIFLLLLLFSHSVMSNSVTPWTTARQAFLALTVSQNLLKLMSTESVMPSNHLILCHPLLLLPSIFPSIRVFSSESALCIR